MNFFKLLFILLAALLLENSVIAEVLDKVIATIGSEPVTSLEIKDILKTKSGTKVDGSLSEVDIKEAILIILFNREAARLGVTITDQEINDYIRRVEISNGGEVGNIEQALAGQGMTLAAYKEKVKLELEKSRILAMNLRSQVQVSDEEVSRYLGKEVEVKGSGEGFYLVQVTYSKDLGVDEIEKIKIYLKDNKKCFTPQEFKAECVNMGVVQIDDLKKDIKEVVEDLELYEIGKLSILDEQGNGTFYMRSESNFGNQSGETFSKLKEQIYQKKFMEKANQFVSKDIFEKYAVEIY